MDCASWGKRDMALPEAPDGRLKLLALTFSATGNTDYVARYLAGKLSHLPVNVELRSIEQIPAEEVKGFDVLAIGFPVFECDSPHFFRAYLERLAPGEGRGAFAFCTKGAVAGNALRRNLGRLVERGYVPLGGVAVGMPGTDGLAFMAKDSWMARAAQNKEYDRLKPADRFARRMTEVLSGLVAGRPVTDYRRPLPLSISGLALDWLWALLYDLFADRLRTQFWADERCNTCSLCARICPVDAITLDDGSPVFDGQACALCMRCIHACPQEAIQIGKSTVDKFRWSGPKGDFKPLRSRPQASDSPAPGIDQDGYPSILSN